MRESVLDFQITFPGVAWWREIWDMPYEVWDLYRQYVEAKRGG